MENNRLYFCNRCGKWCSDSEMIYSDNKINFKNILYYAHELNCCNDEKCALKEFNKLNYEICGDYNGLQIKFLLLNGNEAIKINRNTMYMPFMSTGYLLDNMLKTKIWFNKFEIKENIQQFSFKKRIDIPNNNNEKVTLKDFLFFG